jgi:hypothetical protein
MIIDCISDLNGHYPFLPGGDLLIVAGDLTKSDEISEYFPFLKWLKNQNYAKKVFISGNQDRRLNTPWPRPMKGPFREKENKKFYYFDYLLDSGTIFQDLRIWGSPWTKRCEGMNRHCMDFTVETDEELAEKWALIPQDIDILITHSPPAGVLDEVEKNGRIENAGSESLIKPLCKSGCRLHVFGHIHESYGKFINPINGITYVNASHVNKKYEPVNKPIRIIL